MFVSSLFNLVYGICLLTVYVLMNPTSSDHGDRSPTLTGFFRLMSREIKLAGMEVFADGTSPIILATAKRLASKEIWNAPQVMSALE